MNSKIVWKTSPDTYRHSTLYCFTFESFFSFLKRQSRLQQTTIINIFHCISEKIRLDVSSESSARQRIHMKNQALFSSKDKSKKLKCRLLQLLFGALRVNSITSQHEEEKNQLATE